MPEILFGKLDNFALLSIPMFIIMGASIASTRAGADLYEALERWLTRVPGGLVVSNLGACALFSPRHVRILTGDLRRHRQDGYSRDAPARLSGHVVATGCHRCRRNPRHFDSAFSITMIVYGIATETSIGRLFIAGMVPGADADRVVHDRGRLYATRGNRVKDTVLITARQRFTLAQNGLPDPAKSPAVSGDHSAGMCSTSIYGGVATPSEAAGGRCFLLHRAGRRDLSIDCGNPDANVEWCCSRQHAQESGDDPDDHRRLRLVQLHAFELAVRYPIGRRMDRRVSRSIAGC